MKRGEVPHISQLPRIYTGERYMINQGHVEDGPEGIRYFVNELDGGNDPWDRKFPKAFKTLDVAMAAVALLEGSEETK
jgi:hypothetical protein